MSILQFLLLWIVFLSKESFAEKAEACTDHINSCACKTANGFINLEPLDMAKANGKPKWINQLDKHNSTIVYSYNPCTEFTLGTDGACSNVAGCQTVAGPPVNYPIGTQDTAKFTTDAALGTILTYTAMDPMGQLTRTLKVQLVCDRSQEGALSMLVRI